MIRCTQLPVFPHWRLKVVGDARHSIFIQIRMFANGIGTTVIHIVAQPVCPTAQSDYSHGLNTLGRNHRTMWIGHLDSPAQFRVDIGVARGVISNLSFDTRLLSTIKKEKLRGGYLLQRMSKYPGSKSIGCLRWEKIVFRDRRASP